MTLLVSPFASGLVADTLGALLGQGCGVSIQAVLPGPRARLATSYYEAVRRTVWRR